MNNIDDDNFKSASYKPAADIERGDIILFKPLRERHFIRGIVYDLILRPDGNRVSGFNVLPVTTQLKADRRAPPYPTLEKDNARVVAEAGGGSKHKVVIQFNLTTVVNVKKMTGFDGDAVRVLGSYAGSPLMVELLGRVEKLYHNQQLFRDGRPVIAADRMKIYPPKAAEWDARMNSAARRQAYEAIQSGQKSAVTSLATVYQETLASQAADLAAMTLDDAVEKGLLQERTRHWLGKATMGDTGLAPRTLRDASTLVTETPERLTSIFGLKSKGKIYRGIVDDVTATAALFNQAPPAP